MARHRIAEVYDELILADAVERASRYTITELQAVVRFLRDSRATYERALSELASHPQAGADAS